MVDAKFLQGSLIDTNSDYILLRVPLVDRRSGHQVDAVVRLDVVAYMNAIDGSDMVDVILDSGGLPKRIEQAAPTVEDAGFYDVARTDG